MRRTTAHNGPEDATCAHPPTPAVVYNTTRLYDYVIDCTIELWRFDYGGKSLHTRANGSGAGCARFTSRSAAQRESGAHEHEPPRTGGLLAHTHTHTLTHSHTHSQHTLGIPKGLNHTSSQYRVPLAQQRRNAAGGAAPAAGGSSTGDGDASVGRARALSASPYGQTEHMDG